MIRRSSKSRSLLTIASAEESTCKEYINKQDNKPSANSPHSIESIPDHPSGRLDERGHVSLPTVREERGGKIANLKATSRTCNSGKLSVKPNTRAMYKTSHVSRKSRCRRETVFMLFIVLGTYDEERDARYSEFLGK